MSEMPFKNLCWSPHLTTYVKHKSKSLYASICGYTKRKTTYEKEVRSSSKRNDQRLGMMVQMNFSDTVADVMMGGIYSLACMLSPI